MFFPENKEKNIWKKKHVQVAWFPWLNLTQNPHASFMGLEYLPAVIIKSNMGHGCNIYTQNSTMHVGIGKYSTPIWSIWAVWLLTDFFVSSFFSPFRMFEAHTWLPKVDGLRIISPRFWGWQKNRDHKVGPIFGGFKIDAKMLLVI